MKKTLKIYWPTFLGFIILVLVYFMNFRNINCLAIITDELGYWGNAATIAGYDWKAVLAVTPFYSMGYSLTLVPFFKLGLELSSMYRIAIMMNMVYICISYLCALYITDKLFPNLELRLRQLACFACVASASMLYYSQIAWCEAFLAMLMWCLVALFIRLENKWSYAVPPVIILNITLIYLTHQRAILLIPLTVGILIAICIQNKKYLYSIIIILIMALCLLGYRYMHNWQEEAVYSASDMVMTNGNNVELSSSLVKGYLGKLLNYPKEIVISFLCKAGIVMLTTFFTAAIAYKSNVIRFFQRDFSFWGSRSFILFSALMMLALQSIQMFGDGRKDFTIYSRYMDFAVFPLALMGMCELLQRQRQHQKLYLYSILFSVPTYAITAYYINSVEARYIEPGTPLWASLFERYGINNIFTAGSVLVELCILVLVVYKFLASKEKHWSTYIFLLLIISLQLTAYQSSMRKTIRTRQTEYINIVEKYEMLKEYPDDTVYWLLPEDDELIVDIQYAGELQAMLYNHPIYTLQDVNDLKGDGFVFSASYIDDVDHFDLLIDEKYKLYRYDL